MNATARGAPPPAATPHALVVALDDVVIHTAAARAAALRDACAAMEVAPDTAPGAAAMTGRTMSEVVEAWWAALGDADATRGALLALAAARAEAQWLAAGHAVRIDGAAVTRVQEALTRGARVVLRSDCTRRTAEALLAQCTLAGLPCTLVCADDRLAPASGMGNRLTAARAWATIAHRLQALGVAVTRRVAVEGTHEVAALAAPHVAHVEVWTPSR